MIEVRIGDVMKVDVHHPNVQTFVLTIMTQAAADYATELLNDKNSGWRLERAAQETSVPHPPFGECTALINNGAYMCTNAAEPEPIAANSAV